MTKRVARLLLAAIPAVLLLQGGTAMAAALGPHNGNAASSQGGIFFTLAAAKCPKGEVWKCEKLSAAVKALGHKECRCMVKGRSGH